jgi:hypothetical protein
MILVYSNRTDGPQQNLARIVADVTDLYQHEQKQSVISSDIFGPVYPASVVLTQIGHNSCLHGAEENVISSELVRSSLVSDGTR